MFEINFTNESKKQLLDLQNDNRTPGAYRIFWAYGPLKKQITILAITLHP